MSARGSKPTDVHARVENTVDPTPHLRPLTAMRHGSTRHGTDSDRARRGPSHARAARVADGHSIRTPSCDTGTRDRTVARQRTHTWSLRTVCGPPVERRLAYCHTKESWGGACRRRARERATTHRSAACVLPSPYLSAHARPVSSSHSPRVPRCSRTSIIARRATTAAFAASAAVNPSPRRVYHVHMWGAAAAAAASLRGCCGRGGERAREYSSSSSPSPSPSSSPPPPPPPRPSRHLDAKDAFHLLLPP